MTKTKDEKYKIVNKTIDFLESSGVTINESLEILQILIESHPTVKRSLNDKYIYYKKQ